MTEKIHDLKFFKKLIKRPEELGFDDKGFYEKFTEEGYIVKAKEVAQNGKVECNDVYIFDALDKKNKVVKEIYIELFIYSGIDDFDKDCVELRFVEKRKSDTGEYLYF